VKAITGCVDDRGGAAPELSPPKSACAGDAVLRTSTRGTVPMAAPRPEHASARPAAATPTPRPPHPRKQDGGEIDVLSSANGPSTVALQQRCHHTSASAGSPSWQPMPRPRLQRAATARPEKIQLPIAEQNFPVASSTAFGPSEFDLRSPYAFQVSVGNQMCACSQLQESQKQPRHGTTAKS
jgi:hypothetical protein